MTSLPPRFIKQANSYKPKIYSLSKKYFSYKYSPYFVAQITAESGLRSDVVNSIGACGLGQFMPRTWKWLSELYPDIMQGKSCKDPDANLEATFIYASLNYQNFLYVDNECDRLALTVASHNAGPGRVNLEYKKSKTNWKTKLPVETRNYLKAINKLADLYYEQGWGLSESNKKFCNLV